MRRFVSILSILAIIVSVFAIIGSTLFAQTTTPIFINEIHYDNAGSDSGEGIEVAGPAGTNLSGWTVALYNGSSSQLSVYNTINLTGVIPDQGNGFGTLSFLQAGIQNGAPDGLALVDAGSSVVQFLSYEGSFTAASGPAMGLTSTDIGVSETGSTAAGDSLQLTGSGSTYEDFTWATPAPNTFGAVNTGQSFGGTTSTPTPTPTTPPTGASLVINEIDYDQPSTDTGEFVEIKNTGTEAVNLDAYALDLINGNGGASYNLIDLPNVMLAAGDYFVVCGDASVVPNCDLDVTPDSNLVQNGGPDAVALTLNGAVVDTVSYEGDTAAPYTEGSGAGLADSGSIDFVGISRTPDGVDTDQNNVDLSLHCITPGVTNSPDSTNCPEPQGPPAAPQLLLTEVRVTPTTGEFIEIYNPTGATIDLSNVYLTDATFAGGSTYYYNIVTGANAGGGGFGDFHARFPAGATIAAGAYQTIALTGSADFVAAYGAAPTYELFDDGTANGEQQMLEATAGSINNQGGLSNSGEVVILYYWDGVSDLVADLDYAVWGDKAEAVDKSGIALDGPDADANPTAYQADTAIAAQDIIAGGSHAGGDSWQRDDLTEGAEIQSGGNGTTGSDETSEDLSNTWCASAPTPNAASSCAPTGGELGFCADPATAIHDIQGNGATFNPAFAGTQVIEGVVVASFDGLRGFYLQEEPSQADGDATTSEGIFVYLNGTPTVQVGNVVRVLGTVGEYETSSFGTTSSQTQLEGAIQLLDCGVTTEPVTPTDVTLPVTSIDDFEQYEGMLVRFPQELIISEYFNFDRFGETVLALPMAGQDRPFQPTSVTTPGAAANALQAEILRRRITLDDGRSSQNPDPALHPNGSTFDLTNLFRGGDSVTGATGVLDNTFARYRIQPTAAPTYTSKNPRPAAPVDVGGSLKVASFNVLNYFTTLDNGSPICGPAGNLGCRGADANQPDEFTRQRTKIISAIAAIDADIVGLIEIENNATTAVQDLIDGINAVAGAGTYAFVNTGTIGGDAIKVAFIYKPATVIPVGAHAILDSSVDPNFIDTKNRPSLAQTFEEIATEAKFTVVVNHLKSKGSPCDDVGDPNLNDGQANCNLTRTKAATALVNWLATDPTGSGDPDFLVMGDMNAYAMEDPIAAFETGGFTNLIKLFQGEFAYSFVFDGVYGYLDHALANSSMTAQVSGVTEWHINADEPDILDYDTSFKQDAQDALYEPNAYRSSDHDPVIVGLALTPATPERSQINSLLRLRRIRFRYNPHPQENAPWGVLTIKTKFRNRSQSEIQDIQFEVTRLTRNNLLLNADGGPAGVGAILSVAPEALGSDGILSPHESFTVKFKIGLQTWRPFRFAVDATGVLLNSVTAALDETAPGFEMDITEDDFVEEDENTIFLPLLQR